MEGVETGEGVEVGESGEHVEETSQEVQEAAGGAESADEGLREGESWDKILAAQPPEVQRAMKSLRADYTRKTQSLAAERKALESKLKLWESEGYRGIQAKAQAVPETVDAFDQDSLAAYVEAAAARQLESLIAPIKAEAEAEAAAIAYEGFVEAYPDALNDPEIHAGMVAMLEKHPTLALEDAYFRVQGERAMQAKRREAQRAQARTQAQRAALSTIAAPARPGGRLTAAQRAEMSFAEIAEYYERFGRG